METRAPWFILGILLGAALFIPVVLAQEEIDAWRLDERRLSFQQTPDGFRFESTRDTELGNDVIAGSFSTLNRHYSISYLDQDTTDMTPLQMTVDVEALVEYQDADDDQSYSLGDRIEQRIRLVDLAAPTQEVEPTPNGHRATYSYALANLDPDARDASLVIAFTLSSTPQELAAGRVPPTQPHLEIRVDHFPFQTNSSRLALETRVVANGPLQGEADAFYVAANDRRLVYGWPTESLVDGNERPVHVTLLGSSGQATTPQAPAVVLHSYERGDELSYQPVIGIEREEPEQQNVIVEFLTRGDWRLYAVGALFAFGLIGATMWRRIERA